ncbi:unnamed protein product [Euphydryas editha]|uniref:Uncharacterized protein n=1 Tax=Euphydryas editha TaxID=104508 RepID=A0AAU9TEB0_EUPED|nr:unnamed protein product [Euphydryas editha]
MKEKLNLTDSPTKEEYANFLRSNLPVDWQDVVDTVVDACYERRHKTYIEACPGQGLMNCIVDHLNKNCPVGSWKKEDACTTLQFSPLLDANYIFYQGRYLDFEKNLPVERRPELFMRKYFHEKCCDLPPLYNSSLLECGFKTLVQYHIYATQKKYSAFYTTEKLQLSPPANNSEEDSKRNVYDVLVTTPKLAPNTAKTEENIIFNEYQDDPLDPLDCCDMENFIQKEWRSECDFRLKWDDENRLMILNTSEPVTTTTEAQRSLKNSDVKIVPISCEQESCIFSKLNIISNGTVDKDAFSKLLDNMTNINTEWKKAKAKVARQCLSKLSGYEDTCEINNILACTFDVLTENCPVENKNDPCRHSSSVMDGVNCQISSSKYRPRNRRQFCNLPDFVPQEVRSECGVNLIYKVEYVPEPAARRTAWRTDDNCMKSPESSKCMLRKMNVLNRYGFIDRFKMRRNIGLYAAEFPTIFEQMYKNTLDNIPLYANHCSTSRKFLNLIDSMLTTCPYLKFKKNEKCTNLMKQIRRSSDLRTLEQESMIEDTKKIRRTVPKSSYHSNPLFSFNIFGAGNIPPVQIIDLKATTEKTLVLLPVYQRMFKDPLAINSIHNDGIFRS